MKNARKLRWLQAAIGLACAILVLREVAVAGPTEFSGGYLSGPMLRFADWGSVLLLVGLLALIKFHRVASVVFLIASMLSLPVFSFIVFPGYYAKLFHAESSNSLKSNVYWDPTSVLAMAGLVALSILSLRSLTSQRDLN
jgi:hypothetical protein